MKVEFLNITEYFKNLSIPKRSTVYKHIKEKNFLKLFFYFFSDLLQNPLIVPLKKLDSHKQKDEFGVFDVFEQIHRSDCIHDFSIV